MGFDCYQRGVEWKYRPPVRRLRQRDIPNPNIPAADEPDQPGPALVAQAGSCPVPAHHHVLPLIEPLHELQPLPVDRPSAGDPDVDGVLRQHHVPPVRPPRVVPDPRATEDRRALLDVQDDAGSESDRRREVPAWGEADMAGSRAGVDGGLDGAGVVAGAVPGGSKVTDGDGRRRGSLWLEERRTEEMDENYDGCSEA